MWDQIGSIIVKYWVEFVLGAIVAGGGFFVKRYWKLERAERKRERQEELDAIKESIHQETEEITQTSQERYEEIQKTYCEMAELSTQRYETVQKRIDDEVREKEQDLTLLMQAAYQESVNDDKRIEAHVDAVAENVDILRAGLLSMQGHEFRKKCRVLLEEGHKITTEEWETISDDYDAYKGLGGNHNGDTLFEAVKKKYEAALLK